MGVLGETGNISPWKAVEPFPDAAQTEPWRRPGAAPHQTAAASLQQGPVCAYSSSKARSGVAGVCAASWSPLVKVMAMGPGLKASLFVQWTLGAPS